MTGKDLIIYILKNDLEHCEICTILENMLIDDKTLAVRFGVGVDTIKAWNELGLIRSINLEGHLYFFDSEQDPRKKD